MTFSRVPVQERLISMEYDSGNIVIICAGCRKLHDGHGRWRYMAASEREDPLLRFSHGLCPDCVKKLYPEYSGSSDQAKSLDAGCGEQ